MQKVVRAACSMLCRSLYLCISGEVSSSILLACLFSVHTLQRQMDSLLSRPAKSPVELSVSVKKGERPHSRSRRSRRSNLCRGRKPPIRERCGNSVVPGRTRLPLCAGSKKKTGAVRC